MFRRLALAFNLFACVLTAQAQAKAHQYVIVVDVSASRSKQDLEDAKRFMSGIADELNFGDQLVAVQMQQSGLTDHPKRWSLLVPDRKDNYASARDKDTLESKKRAARLILPTFFQSKDGTVQHTDILATMDVVSEYVRDSAGKLPTILFLSDMLQSARGIEMYHAQRMPSDNFVSSQKKQGLIPSLEGSCVVVIGADMSNRDAVAVEHFWEKYFKAAGAHLSKNDYRNTIPTSLTSVCK